MSRDVIGQVVRRVRFVVYEPAAPGLPWLSVCLGPDDEIIGVTGCPSAEAAKAKTEACAARLASKFENAQVTRLTEYGPLH